MRPVIIGTFVFISAALYAANSAVAFQNGGYVSGQSGTGSKGDAVLGAPLYTGPNVIVIGGGRSYVRHNPYPYSQRRGGYGNRRYSPRYGPGYRRGHGYPDYRYKPYRYNPNRFGNRYPNPRYGVTPPRNNNRYGNDRSYDRGHDRGHDRERYDRYPRLTILGASYRSVDGRACDVFSHVHKRCEGQQSCSIKSSNKICGDPDRGRFKVLEAAYTCGNQELRANVPEKPRSKLRCR